MAGQHKVQAEIVRDPDGGGYRFVVVIGGLRSAPSSLAYPTEAAAWAAASRHGLKLPDAQR